MEGTAGVTGYEAVDVLRARCAEQARAHAHMLAAVWDVVTALAPESDFRTNGPDEFAVDEIRAALGLTRRAAGLLVEQAAVIVHRLPCLHAAMAAGHLDEPRARILAELTADLADSHALAICDQLIPQCVPGVAGRLTTGRLAERVKARAIALDPNWAQRRYESSLTQQRVTGRRQEEGTATLSGTHLPLEQVAASVAHIYGLAAKAKAAGDSRPIDHIRTELFGGMTDGTYEGLSEREILQTLAARRNEAPTDEALPDSGGAPGVARPSRAGVHVKVRLTTQLGLDALPGELAGWGPITDVHARSLIAGLGAAQWRWTLVNSAGQAQRTGLTLARPTGSPRRDAGCKAVVEIVFSADDLGTLSDLDRENAMSHGGWRRVVEDLHRRHTQPARRRADDPHRRFPGNRLRREISTAIPRCVGVGCRAPASTAQIDHLKDYAHGGVTVEINLDPACAHDHRLKTAAGWTLRRHDVASGIFFAWRTRLGHTYYEPVEPVLPPPPPEPKPPPGRYDTDSDPPPF